MYKEDIMAYVAMQPRKVQDIHTFLLNPLIKIINEDIKYLLDNGFITKTYGYIIESNYHETNEIHE